MNRRRPNQSDKTRPRSGAVWIAVLLSMPSVGNGGWLIETNGWTSALRNTLHLRTVPGFRYEIFRTETPGEEGALWQVYFGPTSTNLITWTDLASEYPRLVYYSLKISRPPGTPDPTNVPSQPWFYSGTPCFVVSHTNTAALAPILKVATSITGPFLNASTTTNLSGATNTSGVHVIHYQQDLSAGRFYQVLLRTQ